MRSILVSTCLFGIKSLHYFQAKTIYSAPDETEETEPLDTIVNESENFRVKSKKPAVQKAGLWAGKKISSQVFTQLATNGRVAQAT